MPPKNKNRTKPKSTKKLSVAKRIIINSNNKRRMLGRKPVPLSVQERETYAVVEIFSSLSPQQIYLNFDEIAKSNLIPKASNLTLHRDIVDFYSAATPSATLEQNLSWGLGLISHHRDKLQFFIERQNLITRAILEGDNHLVESILREVDDRCGISLWSIKIRAQLTSCMQNGDQEEKKYLSNAVVENRLLSSLVEKCSFFCNKDSFILFLGTEIANIERINNEYVKNIAWYHIAPKTFIRRCDYFQLLKTEKNASIIDLFLAITSYSELLSEKKELEESDQSKELLRVLDEDFQSVTAKNIRYLNKLICFDDLSLNENFFLICSLHEKGSHKECIEKAIDYGLTRLPFPIIEMVAKSNVRENLLNGSGIIYELIEKMQSVLLKDSDCNKSIQDLDYISYVYRSIDWFNDLKTFIDREGNFSSSEKIFSSEKMLTIRNPMFSPSQSTVFGSEYLVELTKTFPNIWFVRFLYELSVEKGSKLKQLNVPQEILSRYKIKGMIDKGMHFAATENLYNSVSGGTDSLITLESYRLLVDCLIYSEKHDEAVKIFTEESVKNSNYIPIFDIENVISAALLKYKRSEKIDYPISLAIYSKVVDDRYDSDLKYSFELFLERNGMSRPEELFGKEDFFGKEKLHYFLRWVCTPENMSLLETFSDLDDIELSRSRICKYLIKKTKNTSSLTHELIEISKKEAQRLASEDVDKSKIFVDTSVFTGRDSEKFRILFDRYIELKSKTYHDSEDELLFEEICETTRRNESLKDSSISFPSILSSIYIQGMNLNKKNSMFLGLCKLFREEFAYGQKGLNSHLSTRIRHGYLPTAIERPFKDESILFKDNQGSHRIFKKSRWCEGRFIFSDNQADHVYQELCEFSKLLQEHIELINDQWLQIYTLDSEVSQIKNIDEGTIGKINFSVSPIECFYVEKKLPISPTYEDLVKVMIDWLWQKADDSFFEIRNRIENQSRTHIALLTENLLTNIKSKTETCWAQHELCNSVVRAKNKINAQIDLICSWLDRKSSPESNREHDVRVILQMVADSLSIDFTYTEEFKYKIYGSSVNYFVDIFHILFENAISKSRVSHDEIDIEISISDRKNGILFSMKNSCSHNNKDAESLVFYSDAYGDESLINDSIQQEGGTGFFKIWKILEKDMEVESNINLSYEENRFAIVLEIDNLEKHLSK
ncbi:GHKL domain-containing protein [Gilvimarinus sp. SDUM040013]|uniref:GHKL domain-containing protein n=1 Tax=Gilvimarinus gilvus TaxID=3058038 RepID=A0ABU4S2C2_9GAMM|nr:GHKL domain-containing protein [Gilvimarinus sp. SDUM040013]MDO3385634.1 GHKL domain-containing protein [Gilvimarinus sp. SDUM040013]MDX6849968.1 GHKL domain-containing protein [Gilvimarinus sp. SDUM040013]